MAFLIDENHVHMISFISLLFFFLTSFQTTICQQQHNNSEECIKPYTCGEVSNIYYPFWAQNRPSYCGSNNQLYLKCDSHNQNTSIQLGSQNFQVLRIDQVGYSMTMVRKDLVYDNCSSSLTNTSLNSNLFHYMPNVRNITILYNCPHDIKLPIGTKTNGSFSCQEDENKRVFFVDSATAEGLKCEGVRIEVQVSQDVKVGSGIEGLNKALNGGFEVKYVFDSQACLKCLLYNGTCGRNDDKSQFSCFCPDGTEGLDCSHLHDNGWRWKKKVAIGVSVAVVSAITLGIAFYIYYSSRKKTKNIHAISPAALPHSVSGYGSEDTENGSRYRGVHFFTYCELKKATNNFDSARELGDGGFGKVYFGKLGDGRLVAVKRMYENSYRRVEQFVNEVEILTCLHHQNLVSLYGCTSRHSRELLLVYEYVPNGTVADHLHGSRAKPGMLSWHIRMNIAIETASALVYLHATDIIHRDVKTNNILLDNHFSVKVADFGLSRLFPTDVTHISTAPQGTPGYVDPEYHLYYQLTDKSDVFSFGVVLIELISSMPAVDISRKRQEINLSNMAIKKIQNGALHELVDPTLGFESDCRVRRMINAVAELAFQCLQNSKDVRPSMVEVMERLKDIQSDGTYKCKPEVLDISKDDDSALIKNEPPPSSSDSNLTRISIEQ